LIVYLDSEKHSIIHSHFDFYKTDRIITPPADLQTHDNKEKQSRTHKKRDSNGILKELHRRLLLNDLQTNRASFNSTNVICMVRNPYGNQENNGQKAQQKCNRNQFFYKLRLILIEAMFTAHQFLPF